MCRITPIDNGHYRWNLNFVPSRRQAIIGSIEGQKGNASIHIKEYSEDDEHPHRTYAVYSVSLKWGDSLPLFNSSLCSRESCYRDAERRAGNIVEADIVTELDGAGIPAMFSADAAVKRGS